MRCKVSTGDKNFLKLFGLIQSGGLLHKTLGSCQDSRKYIRLNLFPLSSIKALDGDPSYEMEGVG